MRQKKTARQRTPISWFTPQVPGSLELNPDILRICQRCSYLSHHLLPPIECIYKKVGLELTTGTQAQVFSYGERAFHVAYYPLHQMDPGLQFFFFCYILFVWNVIVIPETNSSLKNQEREKKQKSQIYSFHSPHISRWKFSTCLETA